jgi:DNA processing protein
MDGLLHSSPTPFTPPTTEEDRLAWLRLIRSRRVGPGTFFRLLAEHGDAQSALAALPGLARAAGIDEYQPHPRDEALRELAAAARIGARMLCHGAPDYPAALAAISDAPPLLWALGRGDALLARPSVAMVGARNASSLGLRLARKLAEGLGTQGYVVVSGLARGIDAECHGAALKTGTVAVMAGGVDVVYPRENEALAAAIAAQGLRLSEQPMGLIPQARHFPRRNRIISGLALGVVVVEAAEGSGSLITARDALDQGREVMAVPGHPFDARAAGCNALIRDGARLVRSMGDVVDVLGTAAGSAAPPATTGAGAQGTAAAFQGARPPVAQQRAPQNTAAPDTLTLHKLILERLSPSPLAEDQLIRDLALPAAAIAPALLFLELEGRVLRQPGGLLSLG